MMDLESRFSKKEYKAVEEARKLWLADINPRLWMFVLGWLDPKQVGEMIPEEILKLVLSAVEPEWSFSALLGIA